MDRWRSNTLLVIANYGARANNSGSKIRLLYYAIECQRVAICPPFASPFFLFLNDNRGTAKGCIMIDPFPSLNVTREENKLIRKILYEPLSLLRGSTANGSKRRVESRLWKWYNVQWNGYSNSKMSLSSRARELNVSASPAEMKIVFPSDSNTLAPPFMLKYSNFWWSLDIHDVASPLETRRS